ncbi:MAG TPA: HD domain-containing phosphohydrolase [Chloroflexota bacterium]|nr:HD domain-containing phosphohydrolase [Chloroflexota bacterium]
MLQERLLDARILIVDDQEVNIELFRAVLGGGGYTDLHWTLDPRQALALFDEVEPDVVLLDLHMPHLDGIEVLRQLQARIGAHFVPVVVLTGDCSAEARQQALSLGAKDFLNKPFSPVEALLRLRNLLETRHLYLQLAQQNKVLEAAVNQRTRELEETQEEILERLALAAEYRDDATGQHAQRVSDLSYRIALRMGLAEEQAKLISRAALLHDIGKIGIPDHILLKRGRFTADEREVMALHSSIGARIVTGSRSRLLQLAEQVALTHHLRWDRQGGQQGPGDALADEEAFPLAGRIVAVADVFDALTHERPYKSAWPVNEAVAEIRRQSGCQFDPSVVTAFTAVLAEDFLFALPERMLDHSVAA